MSVKIFVMTHKKFNEPEDKIYIPLQVGKAAGQDLGYLGDDTGDNISDLNKYYGELTGVYWRSMILLHQMLYMQKANPTVKIMEKHII